MGFIMTHFGTYKSLGFVLVGPIPSPYFFEAATGEFRALRSTVVKPAVLAQSRARSHF